MAFDTDLIAIDALAFPVAVVAVALLVFIADLVYPDRAEDKRGLGGFTCAALVCVLASTWLVDPSGPAFGGAYVQDAFTLFIQRLVLGAAALGALGSIDHADRVFPKRQGEYYLLILFSLIGMMVLAGARELVLLLVSFELMGIPLYVLAAMRKRNSDAVEGAIKLFLTGSVSSVVTIYGLSFVIGAAGTTWIPALAQVESTPLLVLGMVLTLAGMGFKVGAVPFHMWVPDTYQGSSPPFVAFLSVAPKAAGFAALVRLYLEGFGALRDTWWPVLLVVCIVTLLVGNLMALPQKSVRRLLGYSGVGHIGLLLLAFGIATPEGIGTLLFYLVAYLFTSMGAFFVCEVVAQSRGDKGGDALTDWNGLARSRPALSLAMLIFLLSLGGIPFVAGFWAKILLFWAAWKAGMGLMVLLGASLAVVGLFYYMRVARSIYIEKPEADAPTAAPIGLPTAAAICVAVVGVVGVGVFPRPLLESALEAARVVIGG